MKTTFNKVSYAAAVIVGAAAISAAASIFASGRWPEVTKAIDDKLIEMGVIDPILREKRDHEFACFDRTLFENGMIDWGYTHNPANKGNDGLFHLYVLERTIRLSPSSKVGDVIVFGAPIKEGTVKGAPSKDVVCRVAGADSWAEAEKMPWIKGYVKFTPSI